MYMCNCTYYFILELNRAMWNVDHLIASTMMNSQAINHRTVLSNVWEVKLIRSNIFDRYESCMKKAAL